MKKVVGRHGIAAVIDSLVFVCIIAVIALLILDSQSSVVQSESFDRSSMVHSVLVHSTIAMNDVDRDGENSSEAQVSELLCEALGSGDQALVSRLSARLGSISDPLIEAPYHYRWVVSGANEEISIGESSVPKSCDIMASAIDMKHEGQAIRSVLYLWIL